MILVDGNLLIYAGIAGSSEHEAARDRLDGRPDGSARVGMPWPSLLAFLRLTTNPRVFERPLTVANAWKQMQE